MADTTLTDGFASLSRDLNKVNEPSSTPTTDDTLLPELTLSMKDEELIDLENQWLKKWKPYSEEVVKKQKENEEYWMGKQFGFDKDVTKTKRNLTDNLIFESLETFLPIATRPKADPIVESQDKQQGHDIADKVRKMLSYTADRLSLNLKIKQVTRFWALYMVGIMKVGWSERDNDITCHAIRPQKLILDPEATIEECEYNGYYIGEYIKDTASNLVLRFPKKETFIKDKVKDNMGTSLEYIQWVTDDYIFWTYEHEVLGKNKNPHWNYPTTKAPAMDDMGNQGEPQEIEGHNHFNHPKKPYIFLSIFNIGNHPHDDTNLIQQNLGMQDLVNKRLQQIDKNADNANGGLIISGDALTEQQAGNAGKALRKGGVIWVPTGDVNTAVKRDVGTPLAPFVYQSLIDYRGELRNLFGIRGSSPQGLSGEKTVRGKMFMSQQDQQRIGGGISAYLEEFTDLIFNWFVQLMYVYYDEPHAATILGKDKAKEFITLSAQELTTKLLVGVKEGSMIPSDPLAKRDEALQLWNEKAIDPITLFERLDFPSPRDSAKQLFLWLSDPAQLFPDIQPKQPQERKPSESISFKDLPPEGQAQMASQAGIQLHPQVLAQHQANTKDIKKALRSKQQGIPSPLQLNQ